MSRKKPIIATCLTTGKTINFPSIASTVDEGFGKELINNCLKGRARSHAGYSWAYETPEVATPTPTMLKCAEMRNRGFTNKLIALELGISVNSARGLAGRCILAGLCESRAQGAAIR
ncbi:MAG: hypothetical protein ACRCUF_08550 [Aeromonas sobria]